jgi:hypothetical protein
MSAVKLIESIGNTKGARFAGFTYRSASSNELARYTLLLGADFTELYRKDAEALEALIPTLDGLDRQAAEALLASVQESLTVGVGNNSQYVHAPQNADTYEPIMAGVKAHREDGSVHVLGLLVNKTVLQAGVHKEVKSRPLTLAKKALERNLRRSKIRQFRLPNLLSARINGDTLVLDTTV